MYICKLNNHIHAHIFLAFFDPNVDALTLYPVGPFAPHSLRGVWPTKKVDISTGKYVNNM